MNRLAHRDLPVGKRRSTERKSRLPEPTKDLLLRGVGAQQPDPAYANLSGSFRKTLTPMIVSSWYSRAILRWSWIETRRHS